jgi:ATP-dependent DNA helicase DinG
VPPGRDHASKSRADNVRRPPGKDASHESARQAKPARPAKDGSHGSARQAEPARPGKDDKDGSRRQDPPGVAALLATAVAGIAGAERPGQVTMTEAVHHAIETGEHLAVQAGTGTGKSLAYLVPAARHSVTGGGAVVVSTATIALQRQLIDRDLPRLAGALESQLGRAPVFAILKGRRNYLCLQRLRSGAPDDQEPALFDPRSVSAVGRQVQRLHEWAEQTEVGDRDELVPGVSEQAWRQVAVTARECIGAHRCPFGTRCFAERARDVAGEADIVVTNHALLAIDALEDFDVLPEHEVVIIDEAHDLVDRVTSVASAEASAAAVEAAVRRCGRMIEDKATGRLKEAGEAVAGVLAEIPAGRLDVLAEPLASSLASVRDAAGGCATDLRSSARNTEEEPERLAARRSALAALDELSSAADRILGAFGADVAARSDVVWMDRPAANEPGRPPTLRVAPLAVGDLLAERLFGRRTVALTSATLALGGSFDPLASQWGLPQHGQAGFAPAGPARIAPADPAKVAPAYPAKVAPADGRGQVSSGAAGSAPPGAAGSAPPGAAGSAPPGAAGSAPPGAGGLAPSDAAGPVPPGAGGLAPSDAAGPVPPGAGGPAPSDAAGQHSLAWSGIDVGSPFDHRRSGILYVARHLPPPGRDGLQQSYLDELRELIVAAGGRTLGLFSSMRAARQAADELREQIEHPLLCQGDDPTSQLVSRFAADECSCLFGTLSLWQGVDVPGRSLQLVVIDRIPFPRPDDPLASARQRAVAARGGNGFMTVAAAQAALLLAQGTGRLLRTMSDRGVVAILDPRLVTARYGSFLRESLPPFWTTTDPQVVRGALARLAR